MTHAKEWIPRNQRLFVFSVPIRQRFHGSSLYQPQENRGSMTETQDIWIVTPARDCKTKWERGQRFLARDGFDLEPVDLDLWDEYQNDSEFMDLKHFLAQVGGVVKTQVIAEESILAAIDEET